MFFLKKISSVGVEPPNSAMVNRGILLMMVMIVFDVSWLNRCCRPEFNRVEIVFDQWAAPARPKSLTLRSRFADSGVVCAVGVWLKLWRAGSDVGGRCWRAHRVDLIIAPASQYYYALVGWTGSKHFNRSLRLYAQRRFGRRLTSHGLFDPATVSVHSVG